MGAAENRFHLPGRPQDSLAIQGPPESDVQDGPGVFGHDVGLFAAPDEPDVDRRLPSPQFFQADELGRKFFDCVDTFLWAPAVGGPAANLESKDQPSLPFEFQTSTRQGGFEAEDEGSPLGHPADDIGSRGVPRFLG